MWSVCSPPEMVKQRAHVPQTQCHLPGHHSSSLLASRLEFLGTSLGCTLFGNLFPVDEILKLQKEL